MKKLLIATGSDIINEALGAKLKDDFDIHICPDSHLIIDSLDHFRPEALIINLCLPNITGLDVLSRVTHKPMVIIALTPILTNSIIDEASAAGVGALIRLPCSIDCVVSHLNRLISAE